MYCSLFLYLHPAIKISQCTVYPYSTLRRYPGSAQIPPHPSRPHPSKITIPYADRFDRMQGHVHNTTDNIGAYFSGTPPRHSIWHSHTDMSCLATNLLHNTAKRATCNAQEMPFSTFSIIGVCSERASYEVWTAQSARSNDGPASTWWSGSQWAQRSVQ